MSVNKEFKIIIDKVFSEGLTYENVNRGVQRLQIPSYTFSHDVTKSFPALGLKKLEFKQVVTELLWFLSGNDDITFLKENGCNIWNKDAANFDKENGLKVGRNYGVQWRDYGGVTDQISDLIEGMKRDIMSSRLIVNAWNPAELDKTALPPCHTFFQVVGVPNKGFELHWNQRSVDLFLGLPFNIASYAILGHILERVTGHKFLKLVGDLKCVHLYDNQYEAAREIINRVGYLNTPNLYVEPWKNINDFNIEDFGLRNYNHLGIKRVKMLAPKS